MKIKNPKYIALIGFLIIFVSFFFDDLVQGAILAIHTDIFISFMHFITDFGVVFFVAIVGAVCVLQKKYRFLLFMMLCSVIALEAAFILKLIFQVPRPYLLDYKDPIFIASGFSFPSMHAALFASLLPFQKYIFKKRSTILIYFLMFLIVFSRMYLGVHVFSDIVAGLVVGLLSTYIFLTAEKKYHFVERFQEKVDDRLELRRQSAHLLIGTSIVILLKLQLLNAQILFIVSIVGGILVIVARKIRIPILHTLLEYFERPHHIARFPGRGSFFLILGAACTVLIFEKNIAIAAIMIMAVGDSVTNIIGRHFGRIRNPFNRKKNLLGTGVAIIASTFGALFFVPLWPAFIASTVAMAIESIDLGWKKFEVEIDDNIIIPLVAGAVMTLLM